MTHERMTDERNIYLHDIPLDEAKQRFYEALKASGKPALMPAETVGLRQATGRITAEPIFADISSPHYHGSAMDGYAVDADDTITATETRPQTIAYAQAHAVNTGAPLPENTNAVIMIENVQETDDGIVITAPVAPWQHVRMMGEDMVATELVLPANHKIRPVDLGAIAGCGHHQVNVRRKPRVTLIPTGSELISADSKPQRGQIIEYNSLILGAQIEEAGGIASVTDITPDDREALGKAIDRALAEKPDLLLILSGSSAGSKDFTASMIKERGQLLVHGIAVRPGHPVIMGMLDDVPVIGVPGYPVSATLTGEILIQPLIAHWLGVQPEIEQRPRLSARMGRKLMSPTGDDDFVRVTVAKVGDRVLTAPLSRGAGVITSLVRADGLAHIPRFSEGVDSGDDVEVMLYRPAQQIEHTLLAMGSHDPMLDLLAQYINTIYPQGRLTSANVGSLGGLVALRRKEAHFAGMHLLDDATGEYNLPYIERQLNNIPVKVVTFAKREQGLIVAKDNPHAISGFDDLTRVRFVNRQRGSGTRILLDYELTQRMISIELIEGYQREEYTHLAVAADVASGSADCGLGVRSAAVALGLDFVPVGWERYDLVIPEEYLEHAGIQAMLSVLNDDEFKQVLGSQPGYDASETGTVVQ